MQTINNAYFVSLMLEPFQFYLDSWQICIALYTYILYTIYIK